jgi:hypothetical protein
MKKSLIASFLLCAAMLPAQEQEFGSAVNTTLSAIRSDPDAFRNVRVEFTVQFASLGSLSNPFFTRFTPLEYANLFVWADEQSIWQQREFDAPFGQLFYSKEGDQLSEVFHMKPYQRFKIEGVIRNTFQNMPWIEIITFQSVSGSVDTATLAHLYRGEKFMADRQWQKAIAELSLAQNSAAPGTVQRATYRNLGICHLRTGDSEQAMSCLSTARSFGGDDSELERLLTTATNKPSAELDRAIGTTGLKDHEKPMWDAFDNDARTTGSRTGNATTTPSMPR